MLGTEGQPRCRAHHTRHWQQGQVTARPVPEAPNLRSLARTHKPPRLDMGLLVADSDREHVSYSKTT